MDHLQRALKAAQERVGRAVQALAPKHKGGEIEEFRAAVDEQHRLERELALANREEAAIVIDWQPQWDVGAPLPHVIATGHQTALIYMANVPDPNYGGIAVARRGAEHVGSMDSRRTVQKMPKDFLSEIMDGRTRTNAAFPDLVGEAEARRSLARPIVARREKSGTTRRRRPRQRPGS